MQTVLAVLSALLLLLFSVAASAQPQVVNTAEAAYVPPGFSNQESIPSNTVISQILAPEPQPIALLGLAKRADTPVLLRDSQTGLLNGLARVTYYFVAQNFGDQTLYAVQINDAFAGAGRFGTYTASASPGPGFYTIDASALRVVSLSSGASAAVNAGFDGTYDNWDLLAPGALLPVGAALELALDVVFNTTNVSGPISNQAVVTASPGSPGADPISDNSVDGREPDANGNGDPTDDSSPTIIRVGALEPSGVVYDARSREPLAGMQVRLSVLSCAAAGVPAITPDQLLAFPGTGYQFNTDGSVSMQTDATGRYAFALLAELIAADCQYALSVSDPAGLYNAPSQLLPPQAGLAPPGAVQVQAGAPQGDAPTTHYLALRLASGLAAVTHNHIPMDPPPEEPPPPPPLAGELLLEKSSNKSLVEIGERIEYRLSLQNLSNQPLNSYHIDDYLPTGFAYVAGSAARLLVDEQGNEQRMALADPVRVNGHLRFTLNNQMLALNERAQFVYAVQVGAGAPIGRAINRAQSSVENLQSNQASWAVEVRGGVFSDEAYLIGRVTLACERDEEPDQSAARNDRDNLSHIGIPGVRLMLEDGTSVITDNEGQYSLYGLRAVTRVLKLDTTTLPAGARLMVVDNRNAGQPDSRFVDLRKGELHRADFMVENCDTAQVWDEVQARRAALAGRPGAEGESVTRMTLPLDSASRIQRDSRQLGAQGELTPDGPRRLGETAAANGVFESVMPRNLSTVSSLPDAPVAARPRVSLEELLIDQDNTLGFVDLLDGDTLVMPQIDVRIKSRQGANVTLLVNGEAQPANRIGTHVTIAERQLEGREFIGVQLQPGENQLELQVKDGFGNVRGSEVVRVMAPGKAGNVELIVPRVAVADQGSPVAVQVRLVDDNGILVTARTQLTLDTDGQSRWDIADLNPAEPGTQVFLQGGEAEYYLIPPAMPGDVVVRVSTGFLDQTAEIAFLPELRPLIGAGILEGVIDFRRKGVLPLGESARHSFEEELRRLTWDSDNGRTSAAARSAFFLKGTVRGDYLLTMAFDSDKVAGERLFRDIQPDQFYPVYGDSSTRLFDAQSTERLYLRVDHERSWLLYGDFVTDDEYSQRRLSQYNRALTGVRLHQENEQFSANVFASHDRALQRVVEIPANGTSGPYAIDGAGDLFENSERVEIVVRDRHQTNQILSTRPLTRFTDYIVEPFDNTIRFASPVASLDENLNPRYIRITFEQDAGGDAFWVAGGDVQVRVSDSLQLGASYAEDSNPDLQGSLAGVTAVVKLGDSSVITAELARSDTLDNGSGNGARVEWIHNSEDLDVRAQFSRTDQAFSNLSSGMAGGRTESTVNALYRVNDNNTVRTDLIMNREASLDQQRQGIQTALATQWGGSVQSEIGLRATRNSMGGFVAGAPGEESQPAEAQAIDVLSARARIGMPVPGLLNAHTYLEYEQDVREADARRASLGGSYQVGERSKLYGRYDFLSSLDTSEFSMDAMSSNNVAVLGFETDYLKLGRLFNELRLQDSLDGRQAQAASGVRSRWQLTENLGIGAGFERNQSFGGIKGNESSAVTSSFEYVSSNLFRAFGALEVRDADRGDSYLNTLGIAYRLNQDWSMLARSNISMQRNGADSQTLLSRQQIGFAWRQIENNRWNGLGRYEYYLRDIDQATVSSKEASHVVSAHLNYQLDRSMIMSGRYVYKWGSEQLFDGSSADLRSSMVFARMSKDLGQRFDVSLQGALRWDNVSSRKYALGIEAGMQLTGNTWFSGGYNFSGFRDPAMAAGEHLDRGFFIRLRYKFDENLFRSAATDRTDAPAASGQ